MSNEEEPILATVAELRPRMKSVTVTFKIVELGEEREVVSRDDDSRHRIVDAVVGDSTGTVLMPLWDGAIDSVKVGESYTLTNGYTGLFRGNLRLNIGRYGQLSPAGTPIEDVNRDVDMSAEEHEDTRRPRRDYGGGRERRYGSDFGGRGAGRSYGGDYEYGGRDRQGRGRGRRDRRY